MELGIVCSGVSQKLYEVTDGFDPESLTEEDKQELIVHGLLSKNIKGFPEKEPFYENYYCIRPNHFFLINPDTLADTHAFWDGEMWDDSLRSKNLHIQVFEEPTINLPKYLKGVVVAHAIDEVRMKVKLPFFVNEYDFESDALFTRGYKAYSKFCKGLAIQVNNTLLDRYFTVMSNFQIYYLSSRKQVYLARHVYEQRYYRRTHSYNIWEDYVDEYEEDPSFSEIVNQYGVAHIQDELDKCQLEILEFNRTPICQELFYCDKKDKTIEL